jgi:hypothetical protein
MMNRTRRTIGLSAFAMLVVLGAGWALEKAHSNSQRQGGAAVVEPASNAATTPLSDEPLNVRPAPADSSPEYDRSDLLLIQG